MSNEVEEFNLFAEPGAIDILLFILDKKEVTRTDVKKNISGNYYRLRDFVLKGLESIGLVTMTIEEKPYLTYKYTLTENGKKVASKLAEIKSLIS